MHKKSKDLQNQYEGFLKTPFLWHGKGVFGLEQFEIIPSAIRSFLIEMKQKLRLGKMVERFVSFELAQNTSIRILCENIQIQQEKRTLGELDCILLKNNTPIHLEIIYKFYLYDSSVGNTEIEHWIGPNRRDSLIKKITKLKEKQLPLLYHLQTQPLLNELNLKTNKIQQQVYFKAQLFVPLNDISNHSCVNTNCIEGFYIYPDRLKEFNNCKFYIPNKHNWLTKPHVNVNWLNFHEFKLQLQVFLIEENAPLCWLKKTNGEFIKFFVVWW
ncbi:DUF1853 family protein [Tenacibaculum sp.]|nr:DUF1853 family protein [Tenacibaculum sp.]